MTPAIAPAAPGGRAWRTEQREAVLRFAARSALPGGGFGWLDANGDIDASRDLELWINARMTYVFSLGSLLDESLHPLAEQGVRALRTLFADPQNGGWYRSVRSDGTPVETTKGCYEHAFMVLAGSTAHVAGVPGADALLEEALATHSRRVGGEQPGPCRESWNAVGNEREA